MKISIITVVYNNHKTIEAAIKSVVEQTYKNIEYIIIDGGSTDGTLDIINRFNSNIDILVSEKDKGIYNAMNKGIRLATGDVIGILNSDDLYFDNNVLTEVANCFVLNKEMDMVYGDLVYVKRDNTNKIIRNWISKPYYNHFFENGNVPPHTSLFIKSEVYKTAGLFNEALELASDYDLMLRVFKKHQFKSFYIRIYMIKMRLGGSTNKSLYNIIKGNQEILLSWRLNGLNPPKRLMPIKFFKRILQFF